MRFLAVIGPLTIEHKETDIGPHEHQQAGLAVWSDRPILADPRNDTIIVGTYYSDAQDRGNYPDEFAPSVISTGWGDYVVIRSVDRDGDADMSGAVRNWAGSAK